MNPLAISEYEKRGTRLLPAPLPKLSRDTAPLSPETRRKVVVAHMEDATLAAGLRPPRRPGRWWRLFLW